MSGMKTGRGGRRRAIFLDRDGVLNRTAVRRGKPYAPRRMQDFILLPGAAQAVRDLKRMGFLVIVATNQPDVGNGLVDAATVARMHDRLCELAPVDDIRTCPHRQTEGCACRKPKPGLLLAAARSWRVDLGRSYMVGDRASDVVAGHRAGCYTILVDRRYAERHLAAPDARVRSLPAAVRAIAAVERTRGKTKGAAGI